MRGRWSRCAGTASAAAARRARRARTQRERRRAVSRCSANDMTKWLALQLARGKLPSGEPPVQRGGARSRCGSRRCCMPIGALPRTAQAGRPDVPGLCAGLGRQGLSRHQAHLRTAARCSASRASVVLMPSSRTSASPSSINSEDGEIALRADVRAARPLPRPAAATTGPGKLIAFKQRAASQEALKALDAPPRPRLPRWDLHCRSRATPARTPTRGTATSSSRFATAR